MRQQFDDRDPSRWPPREASRDRNPYDSENTRDRDSEREWSRGQDPTRTDWAGGHRPGAHSGYREAGYGQRHNAGQGLEREWDETDYTGRGARMGGRSSFDDGYQGREERWSEQGAGRYGGGSFDRQRDASRGGPVGYERGGAYGPGLESTGSGHDHYAGDTERGYRRGMGGSYYEYPEEGGRGGRLGGRGGGMDLDARSQRPWGAQGHRGKGPKNYTRSDERISDDLNERLSDDDIVDASDIEVQVSGGKVTLNGSVEERWQKHRAEDIACACGGVQEVDNRIRIQQGSRPSRAESVLSGSSDAGPGSGRNTGDVTGQRTSGL